MCIRDSHCFWRRSFSELETASCNLISIKTVEGVRVFKSLELLKSQRNRAEISGRSTPSSRGVVMRCPDGYALFAINPHPSRFISLMYFGNVYFSENLLSGFMVLARKEYFQRRRFSRCVLELLPQTSNCILNAARRTSRKLPMEDLPIMIKDVIETPLWKCFSFLKRAERYSLSAPSKKIRWKRVFGATPAIRRRMPRP